MTLPTVLALFLIGTVASVFGSVVGLGGAFIVVPVMRIAFGIPPSQAAGTSLLMVFANTLAATFGYLRNGVVDVRLATPFALGAVPGSIVGVLAVHRFTPTGFDVAYGAVMIVLSVLVLRRRSVESRPAGDATFAHDWRVGAIGGIGIGFFSSLFGVGAGVILIPLLLIAARMPPHVVTATGAFVITLTSPVGVLAHIAGGDVDWAFALPLVFGGLVGGSFGPPLAKRVSSPRLITLLSVALVVAAAGLVLRHLA